MNYNCPDKCLFTVYMALFVIFSTLLKWNTVNTGVQAASFCSKLSYQIGGCGLSAKTSVHHAVNLHKLTLFSENFSLHRPVQQNNKNFVNWIYQRRTHWSLLLRVWWLLKELFLCELNRFNIAFLEQVNVTQQGNSIPPQTSLQCQQWPLTSTEIDPPQARKYHAILEYSCGKWLTISLPFNSLTANLLHWLSNSLRRACEWK